MREDWITNQEVLNREKESLVIHTQMIGHTFKHMGLLRDISEVEIGKRNGEKGLD